MSTQELTDIAAQWKAARLTARYVYIGLLVATLTLGWGLGTASSERTNTAAAKAYIHELFVARLAELQREHARDLGAQAEAHAKVRARLEDVIELHRELMRRASVRLPAWRDE